MGAENKGKPLVWLGRTLTTYGQIMDAATACKTQEEAQEFLAAYSEVNPLASENIGYLSGYCDEATRNRLRDLFGVKHPILGGVVDPAGAFNFGRALADPKEG